MKKFRKIISITLLSVLLAIPFSGCNKVDEVVDEVTSECDDPQNYLDYENRYFKMGCTLRYSDGNPAESFKVSMKIWYEPCQGGKFKEDSSTILKQTDIYGYWFSEMNNHQQYSNIKDQVNVKFWIRKEGYTDFFHTQVYRWEDVDDECLPDGEILNRFLNIKLPYLEGEAPLANFKASDSAVAVGQSINFSDLSSNNPTSWEWDFGDGNTSQDQNPSHSYDNSGGYTVSLKAINDYGSGIETKEDYIIVSPVVPAPVADFYANETFIDIGQLIDFSDLSINSPTSWQWDFGDGNTSTVQNPSHSYDNSGSYTISLTATNASGFHTETKGDYIVVEEEPCEGFSYQGQNYNAVLIGDQCWMKENMNYETDNSWCYDDDPANCAIYGRLYTWEAALNVCPSGWHLPNNFEYGNLSSRLGGRHYSGGKMKEEGTAHWNSPNTDATNESGFSALPGGYRTTGPFVELGEWGHWWTSSPSTSDVNAINRAIPYSNGTLYSRDAFKSWARSVRCLRD